VQTACKLGMARSRTRMVLKKAEGPKRAAMARRTGMSLKPRCTTSMRSTYSRMSALCFLKALCACAGAAELIVTHHVEQKKARNAGAWMRYSVATSSWF